MPASCPCGSTVTIYCEGMVCHSFLTLTAIMVLGILPLNAFATDGAEDNVMQTQRAEPMLTEQQTEHPATPVPSDDPIPEISAAQEPYIPDVDAVTAIRAAIYVLPDVVYVRNPDRDTAADELDEIYSNLAGAETLLMTAEEELTEDQKTAFEAAIGLEYIEKYSAIYT